jgi:hypothetical protein
MSEGFWTAFWVGLPMTVTSVASAYVVIRQTNAKTEKKAEETKRVVTDSATVNREATLKVGEGVDGNLDKLNAQLREQTEEIRRLNQVAADKATAREDRP